MSDADRTTCDVLTLACAIFAAEAAGMVILHIVGAGPASTAAVAGMVLVAAFSVAGCLLRSHPGATPKAVATPTPAPERSPRTR